MQDTSSVLRVQCSVHVQGLDLGWHELSHIHIAAAGLRGEVGGLHPFPRTGGGGNAGEGICDGDCDRSNSATAGAMTLSLRAFQKCQKCTTRW